MKTVQIPKRSGGYRTIYVPDGEEMARYRSLLPTVAAAAERACRAAGDHAHGFRPGRSPVTNAMVHAGRPWVLCLDLEHWYDSVRRDQISGLPADVIDACLIDGAPRQGLPTSPCVANIAGAKLDEAIAKALKKKGLTAAGVRYSRYADDLTISGRARDDVLAAEQLVLGCVQRMGWRLKARKRHLTPPHIRPTITGVVLGEDGQPRATRRLRRTARAAAHRESTGRGMDHRGRGVVEWCAMRAPRQAAPWDVEETAARWRQDIQTYIASRGCRRYRRALLGRCTPGQVQLQRCGPGGTIITADPIYLVEPSGYAYRWRSCFSPGGSYYHQSPALATIEGAMIAVLPHRCESVTVHGVTRPALLARARVWRGRAGGWYYDRIYGTGPESVEMLRQDLRAMGLVPVRLGTARAEKVIGRLLGRKRYYLDYACAVSATWEGRPCVVLYC
jgi:hypothetical protein